MFPSSFVYLDKTTLSFKVQDMLARFSVIFYKVGNFCDFQIPFLHSMSLIKRCLLKMKKKRKKKRKNFGSKFFPFEVDNLNSEYSCLNGVVILTFRIIHI